jgi:Tfp pilus assembly protein PilN
MYQSRHKIPISKALEVIEILLLYSETETEDGDLLEKQKEQLDEQARTIERMGKVIDKLNQRVSSLENSISKENNYSSIAEIS